MSKYWERFVHALELINIYVYLITERLTEKDNEKVAEDKNGVVRMIILARNVQSSMSFIWESELYSEYAQYMLNILLYMYTYIMLIEYKVIVNSQPSILIHSHFNRTWPTLIFYQFYLYFFITATLALMVCYKTTKRNEQIKISA